MTDRIGNYNVLEKIGEGGMGAVYLAQRADLPQKVALKIIRRDADSAVVLRRFRREQEILAALEHPNIARLLDVGVAESGLPFLAMEYVEGVDLIRYCGRTDLSITEKLKIFRKVCEAVSYAHSRLVVHRDLKPSNILVNQKGEPKLLDFGISKLLSDVQSSDDKGTVTSFGMLTPNYASPEQFRGETVSTLTDVYSLGVILYELLTGNLPYEVGSKRFDEVARIVCETEPTRPSSVVGKPWSPPGKETEESTVITDKTASADNLKPKIRNTKFLKGDLDNIILKALRKEPARRYQSVEQFSEDLRRHLAGLTVTARPATFSYRAEKFVRRNFAGVAAGFLIFLSLFVGIIGVGWQYVRAEGQRRIAERRFGEVRQLANNVVFKYYDEIKDLEGATKAKEMMVGDALNSLDNLARNAAGDASLQLELAQAYIRIGNIYGGAMQANTGDTASAVGSYEKAARILDDLMRASPDEPKILEQKREVDKRLGLAYRRAGKTEEARRFLEEGVSLSEKLYALNPSETTQKIMLAQSYVNLCRILPKGTKPGESVETCRKAIPILSEALAKEPHNKAVVLEMNTTENILGIQYGILADGVDKAADSERSRELYGEAANHFGRSWTLAGQLVAAEPNNAAYRRSRFGARTNESTARLSSGNPESALKIQKEMLSEASDIVAKDAANVEAKHDLASVYGQIGLTFIERKDFASAVDNFNQALVFLEQVISKDGENAEAQKDKFDVEINLGKSLIQQNEHDAAVKTFRAAFAGVQKAPMLKETPFVGYAEGRMHEQIGDCEIARIEKSNPPNQTRKSLLANARAEYGKAVELWNDEKSAPEKFGLSPETVETAKQKAADCENLLAKL